MAQSLTWLTPLIATTLTALFGYLIAARRASGKVSSTEAGKLWDEAAALRSVYRDEIDRLQSEIERGDEEVAKLEEHNRRLRSEVVQLQKRNDTLEREVARLQARVTDLEEGNHAPT